MSQPISTFDLSTGPATQDTRSWEYVASRRFVLTVANLEPHAVALQLQFLCPTGTLSEAHRIDGRDVPANHRWTWRVGHTVAEDGALTGLPWGRGGQRLASPALHLGAGQAGVFELAPRSTSSTSFVTRVGSVGVQRLPTSWAALRTGLPVARLLLTPETHVVYAPPKGVVADEPFIDELDHGVVPLPTAGGSALFGFLAEDALLDGDGDLDALLGLLGGPAAGEALDLGLLRSRLPDGDPRFASLHALLDGPPIP
ncbi:MAG: hypothetical protein H6742_10380 [Alphaproteobacteria bacterium]|nr:hypothetical protein [Alphaproteobacteria bacterium]